MKIKFEDFLLEYTGPYKKAGFKIGSENRDIYDFDCTIKIESENEEEIKNKLKNILNEYDIDYTELSIQKETDEFHKLNISFKSYNEYEAYSLVDTVINDALKNTLFKLDINSINLKLPGEPPIERNKKYSDTNIGFMKNK